MLWRRREVCGRPALQVRLLLRAFIARLFENLAERFVRVLDVDVAKMGNFGM